MACVQVLAHCGGPLVSSVKFGTLGRSFGAAIASLCNSPFEVPQQGKRKMTSNDKQKSTELTYFSMPDHSQSVRNLNTIAEDEVVADVDLEQEWRQQMVQNGREIVDLTEKCRQRKELLDFQKGLLEEKDREIQDWVTKVEHLQAQRDQGAGVASGKPVMAVDEQLEAEWQKFVLDEKDDEIKKLRAEVEKLKAENTKTRQSSEEVESFLLRPALRTELRARNTAELPCMLKFEDTSSEDSEFEDTLPEDSGEDVNDVVIAQQEFFESGASNGQNPISTVTQAEHANVSALYQRRFGEQRPSFCGLNVPKVDVIRRELGQSLGQRDLNGMVLGAELERVRAELVKANDLFNPLMHSPIAGA